MFRLFAIIGLILLQSSEAFCQNKSRIARGLSQSVRISAPLSTRSLPSTVSSTNYNNSRCLNGEDPRCQKSMENQISREIQNLERSERASLGRDFCLYYQDNPRCRGEAKRDEQRSQREIDSYCSKNPDAPRCIGDSLNSSSHAREAIPVQSSSNTVQRLTKDDFFAFPQPVPQNDEDD